MTTLLAVIGLGALLCIGMGIILFSSFLHGASQLGGDDGGSKNWQNGGNFALALGMDNDVTLTAKELASHLRDCRGMEEWYAIQNNCGPVNAPFPRYASYDKSFPKDILAHGAGYLEWLKGNFQCVSFVMASYSRFHPLPTSANAQYLLNAFDGWPDFEIIPGNRLPVTPGDIFVMAGGTWGHTGIVLGWEPPHDGHTGILTVAQANTWKPIESFQIAIDNTIMYTNGYWAGYSVIGYIHPKWLPVVAPNQENSSPSQIENDKYVDVARQAAQDAGIQSDIFIRQIQAESSFNPNARSDAGAVGIAQFMPEIAASLGVNPLDPIASLQAAAQFDAKNLQYYHGDYAKMLACYHAGAPAVDHAIKQYGLDWLQHMDPTTQAYVHVILQR